MKQVIREEVELPKGVTASVENSVLTVTGPKGAIKRKVKFAKVVCAVENGSIVFGYEKATKREKAIIGSNISHAKNMIKGVTEKFAYKLKICSGHFPMNVSVSGTKFTVKNFLGEKIPRTLELNPNVAVKVNSPELVVEGLSVEEVSQQAAAIEQLMRITNRDRRIFQDGIFIVSKEDK